MNEEQSKLIEILQKAISLVYQEDRPLFEFAGEDRDGLEQAFVFRVGVYLSRLLIDTDYKILDLDSEYNKKFGKPKTVNGHKVRPDLILHKRNSNEKNKLVVEFKGWWNTQVEDDISKLRELTSTTDEYHYLIGVFIKLGRTNAESLSRYFIDGNEI